MPETTGFLYHPAYLLHDPGPFTTGEGGSPYPFEDAVPHPEGPLRVKRVKELVDLTGLRDRLTPLEARAADYEQLTLFHTPDYVRRVLDIAVRLGYGDAGEWATLSRGSFEVALLSAGGVIAAVDAVLEGRVTNANALVRPPGHHALRDRGMGYCIFNNVAVAAKDARVRQRAERVAIIDWDVHHGNGTQAAFYDDPSVLFISLHQDQLYPANSGLIADVGEGKGEGATVNIPLPSGTGDAGYLAAFERIVVPVLKQFSPDLILVSSGFDASLADPDGRMMVSTEGFRKMMRHVKAVATDVGGGRVVVAQEGGYSWDYGPYCALAIIEELAGTPAAFGDPSGLAERMPPILEPGANALQAIDAIIGFQRRYWKL